MTFAYPLSITFRILTIGAHMRVVDASGQVVAYAKQKAFRLREDVTIFADEAQTRPLYRIRTRQIIDIGATYTITTPDERPLGALRQRGVRTLWSATYDVVDAADRPLGIIHEENAWVKVLDGLVGGIPLVGLVVQQWINPTYLFDTADGTTVLRLRKRPSLIERRFMLESVTPPPPDLQAVTLPATLMVVLLERERG
jgi:hypothetical protein